MGVLSAWTLWADCSVSCGVGQRYRARGVIAEATFSGKRCNAQLKETAECVSEQTCGKSRNCQWADWSLWGGCTCSCGGGQRTRDRSILKSPLGDGRLCDPSDRTQIQPCGMQPCGGNVCIDGKWSDWDSWGSCTTSCGAGVTWRRRKILAEASDCGIPALGDDREFRQCHKKPCFKDKDCELTKWSEWSACSCSRDGVKRRARNIEKYGQRNGAWCSGPTKEIAGCNLAGAPIDVHKEVINCSLGEW